MDATPILDVRDIHTFIGPFSVLEGVSVSVPQGSITAVLGRNGAGKTTTLKSIMAITPPRQGQILFDGQDLVGHRSVDVARLGIGFVPDYRAVFRALSVEENLRLAERRKGDYARRSEFVFELFPDLKRLIKLRGSQLSGGQQQMLAIARALIPENRLLLIDEPTEGLAPVLIEQLMAAIRRLASETTVLLVEQNFIVAGQLAERYVIVDEGRSVKAGPMAELLQAPEIVQRYLGVTA